MNFMMYQWESNIFKIFLCFMVIELSQYDMDITFKQYGNIEL